MCVCVCAGRLIRWRAQRGACQSHAALDQCNTQMGQPRRRRKWEGRWFWSGGAGDPLGRVRCHKILASGPQGRLLLQVRREGRANWALVAEPSRGGRIGGMGRGGVCTHRTRAVGNWAGWACLGVGGASACEGGCLRLRKGCGGERLLEARGGDGTQERGSEKGDSGWSGRYYTTHRVPENSTFSPLLLGWRFYPCPPHAATTATVRQTR